MCSSFKWLGSIIHINLCKNVNTIVRSGSPGGTFCTAVLKHLDPIDDGAAGTTQWPLLNPATCGLTDGLFMSVVLLNYNVPSR